MAERKAKGIHNESLSRIFFTFKWAYLWLPSGETLGLNLKIGTYAKVGKQKIEVTGSACESGLTDSVHLQIKAGILPFGNGATTLIGGLTSLNFFEDGEFAFFGREDARGRPMGERKPLNTPSELDKYRVTETKIFMSPGLAGS